MKRRTTLKSMGAAGFAGLFGTERLSNELRGGSDEETLSSGTTVKVDQPEGRMVRWVPPGKESPYDQVMFGTPQNPEGTFAEVEEALDELVTDPEFKKFAKMMKPLTGVPDSEKWRKTDLEGTRYEFGKGMRNAAFFDVEGKLDLTYEDRRPYDLKATVGTDTEAVDLSDTPDSVSLGSTWFTDPDGNEYRIEVQSTIEHPHPFYETGGGVITNTWFHGITGTSPILFSRVYTPATTWAVADLYMNGSKVDENKLLHVMTTQASRKRNFEPAVTDEMPLMPNETPTGKLHHTHMILRPHTITPDGDTTGASPVNHGFEYNGKKQPLIHIMWEDEDISGAPFGDWQPRPSGKEAMSSEGQDVRAYQSSGGLVHWGKPGRRQLSRLVFGTPDTARELAEPKRRLARKLLSPARARQAEKLLDDFPFLVGVPPSEREDHPTKDEYTTTSSDVPFGIDLEAVSGEFDVTYRDRRPYDLGGQLTDTPDDVDVAATFTDPAGNSYELRNLTTYQFPAPVYQTGGGVTTGAYLHGTTGTGSPLLPRMFTYGAFWAIGDVAVNGSVPAGNQNKLVQFMTSQAVYNNDGDLALDEDLPLDPAETIAGHTHQTHGIVHPVTVRDVEKKMRKFRDLPKYEAVETGMNQEFIHVVWQEDTVEGHPFAGWSF